MTQTVAEPTAGLRVGDLVEVRSAAEILATLDEHGELDNLPFMPEMLEFCGKQLTVHKVANKVCDPYGRTGMHRMTETVHLTGARCAGSSHGGCQTACSLYWKQAWLKRVEPGTPRVRVRGHRPRPTAPASIWSCSRSIRASHRSRAAGSATPASRPR
ncbi:conserved hypothetical protein [Nocardia seriolae]|nr:conserved hypothetical protein [Nocardia seriolae]